MIVKNAESDLPQCLASLKPYIGYWCISDTGSTDSTIKIIHKMLDGIPGELREDQFVNFGHNRSLVFAAIRGHCRWIAASDADMEWTFEDGWEPGPEVAAAMLEMGKHTSFSYRLPLLLRGDLPWRSVGAAHEYTVLEDGTYGNRVPTDKVRIDMGAIDRSSPEKSRFYASLLEADLEKDPDNPRTVAYLGQTYRDLGRRDDAKAMFDRRAKMPGWDQETFYAAYQAALYDPWPQQAMSLLAAWELRPQRLEPLYCLIAELNRRDLHRAAYTLSLVTPPLCDDILFVEDWVWSWGFRFQRSIAAWYCGHPGESRNLCDELLAMELPVNIRACVERNRAL
jgi:hypothetical protein